MELRTLRQAWKLVHQAGEVAELPPPMPDLGAYYTPKDRWLPRDEMLKLIAALPPERTDYVVVVAQTGLDKGELEALTSAHCDFRQGVIRPPGTKNRYRQGRLVPMTDEVYDILVRRAQGNEGALFPPWGNSVRGLRNACKRAGIADCSLKDLRRTFASEHAALGTHELVLQRMMGHADSRMLARVYAQFADETLIEAGRRLRSYQPRSGVKLVSISCTNSADLAGNAEDAKPADGENPVKRPEKPA